LELGEPVLTLTGHPERPTGFGPAVKAFPFRFEDPEAMAKSLTGVRVLYNTYWIRFDRGAATHERAIAHTRALFRAAERAGVERVVHISISNPDSRSPLPYFRGKALLEQDVRNASFSYAIVRPTVVFGAEDILINNIAYLLRHAPLFLIPGKGDYRLQPVYAGDLAQIAVDAARASGNLLIDAVGPEVFTFDELVRVVARTVGSRAALLHASSRVTLFAARILGAVLHDVLLTPDEVEGLMANLLVSGAAPTGSTRLTHWLAENAATVGVRYASELRRHFVA
jgi:NADH dehydrogenase